jgi:hypothetical protein
MNVGMPRKNLISFAIIARSNQSHSSCDSVLVYDSGKEFVLRD